MTLQRAALWAIVIAATMYLLVAGRGLLLPLVLGLALWYMVDALADAFEQPRLGRLRPPRPIAVPTWWASSTHRPSANCSTASVEWYQNSAKTAKLQINHF